MSNKLIVGVVFGGRSVEHEVSLMSAKSIITNLDTNKYKVFPILIEKNGTWRRVEIEEWLKEGELKVFRNSELTPSLNPNKPALYEISKDRIIKDYRVDVLFPVLHGTYGEDGTVQGLFELMGVPFVGASVLGSSIGMDKITMKTLFRAAGLPVVKFIGIYQHNWKTGKEKIRKEILYEIGIPCFVKAANLGSSVGIIKVKSEDKLDEAVEFASEFSTRIIIEKAVLTPREIEVSVLGNENPIVSYPGEIVPHREFYDYLAKYIEEGTELIAPTELEEGLVRKFQEYALRAYKAIDCTGMARVDFLMERDTYEIFVSEINTIPGFTHISMYPKLWEVSGIRYRELVTRLIELALERYELKKNLRTDQV